MAITATQLRVLVSDPPTPDAPQIFDDGHYEAIGSMETNLYKAAGSPAGFISYGNAPIHPLYLAKRSKINNRCA